MLGDVYRLALLCVMLVLTATFAVMAISQAKVGPYALMVLMTAMLHTLVTMATPQLRRLFMLEGAQRYWVRAKYYVLQCVRCIVLSVALGLGAYSDAPLSLVLVGAVICLVELFATMRDAAWGSEHTCFDPRQESDEEPDEEVQLDLEGP